MSDKLRGKTALVTGGGGGIGRGIALALAEEGANVAVCGRTSAPLGVVCHEIAGRGVRGLPVVCDVTELSQLEALVACVVAEFGTVDILVNNAMVIPHGTLLETDEEAIDIAWRSGPLAALRLMRLCHPYLSGGGSIINVSSSAAIQSEIPLRAVYGAVKMAMNVLSRAAAVEWGPDAIRVNTILPFARSNAVDKLFEHEPEFANSIVARLPLGRVGDPETDIGPVVAFLAGPDARYVTSAVVACDGGVGYVR